MIIDINTIREIVTPFVQVFSALILSGASVSLVTQLLKLDWFPVAVSKFPRLTSAVLSVGASFAAIYASGVNLILSSWVEYAGFIIGTILLAAATYARVLKGTTTKDSRNAAL